MFFYCYNLFLLTDSLQSQRFVRWSLFLSEFNFKIAYRASSANGKFDVLSRRPDYASCEEELSSSILFNVLRPENFTFFNKIVCNIQKIIYNNQLMLMIILFVKSLKIICLFNVFHVSFSSLCVFTSSKEISCTMLLDIYAIS